MPARSNGALAQAWCKGCRHALHGLPPSENKCPECGREFDLHDPRTFAHRPSSRARRIFLVALALGVAALVWLLWPEGRIVATVAVTTNQGKVTYVRWRFHTPVWNPLHFVGWTSITGDPALLAQSSQSTTVVASVAGGPRPWFGTATFPPGFPPRVLGDVFGDETASSLLNRMIQGKRSVPPPGPQ